MISNNLIVAIQASSFLNLAVTIRRKIKLGSSNFGSSNGLIMGCTVLNIMQIYFWHRVMWPIYST